MSEGHLIVRIALLALIGAAEPLNHRLFQNQFATERYYYQELKAIITSNLLF